MVTQLVRNADTFGARPVAKDSISTLVQINGGFVAAGSSVTMSGNAKIVGGNALAGGAVYMAAGTSFEKAVKTTCFLADIADFAAFNEIYGKYFTGKPARSCVAVRDLPKGVLAEVEVIAEL